MKVGGRRSRAHLHIGAPSFSHIVIRFGRPTPAMSIAPEMMPSLSCAGPPRRRPFDLHVAEPLELCMLLDQLLVFP